MAGGGVGGGGGGGERWNGRGRPLEAGAEVRREADGMVKTTVECWLLEVVVAVDSRLSDFFDVWKNGVGGGKQSMMANAHVTRI